MHLRVISDGVAEWDLCHNVNVQGALIALRINYYPIYRPSWIARQCVNACKCGNFRVFCGAASSGKL